MTTTPDLTAQEAQIAERAAALSNEALCLAWLATEGEPATRPLALVRGRIMDELHKRLGDDRYDEWLMAADENDNTPNPLGYLARERAEKGAQP